MNALSFTMIEFATESIVPPFSVNVPVRPAVVDELPTLKLAEAEPEAPLNREIDEVKSMAPTDRLPTAPVLLLNPVLVLVEKLMPQPRLV